MEVAVAINDNRKYTSSLDRTKKENSDYYQYIIFIFIFIGFYLQKFLVLITYIKDYITKFNSLIIIINNYTSLCKYIHSFQQNLFIDNI